MHILPITPLVGGATNGPTDTTLLNVQNPELAFGQVFAAFYQDAGSTEDHSQPSQRNETSLEEISPEEMHLVEVEQDEVLDDVEGIPRKQRIEIGQDDRSETKAAVQVNGEVTPEQPSEKAAPSMSEIAKALPWAHSDIATRAVEQQSLPQKVSSTDGTIKAPVQESLIAQKPTIMAPLGLDTSRQNSVGGTRGETVLAQGQPAQSIQHSSEAMTTVQVPLQSDSKDIAQNSNPRTTPVQEHPVPRNDSIQQRPAAHPASIQHSATNVDDRAVRAEPLAKVPAGTFEGAVAKASATPSEPVRAGGGSISESRPMPITPETTVHQGAVEKSRDTAASSPPPRIVSAPAEPASNPLLQPPTMTLAAPMPWRPVSFSSQQADRSISNEVGVQMTAPASVQPAISNPSNAAPGIERSDPLPVAARPTADPIPARGGIPASYVSDAQTGARSPMPIVVQQTSQPLLEAIPLPAEQASIQSGPEEVAVLRAIAESGAAPMETTTQISRQQTPAARMVALQLAQMAPQLSEKPVEIALNPEELGRVRMVLSGADGAMTVSVMAERGETIELLRRHIDMLAQEFKEIGYDNLSFAFSQGDQEENPGGQHALAQLDGDASPVDSSSTAPDAVMLTDGLDIRL